VQLVPLSYSSPSKRDPLSAHSGFVAYFALKHPQDDVRQLIEHALGRMGYVSLGEDEETRANVLVLEPASAPHLEAARRLRELRPDLPIVCVSVLPPFPEVLELRPAAYLVKPFTIAGLRATVESVLNASLGGFPA
jgi:DNA-binding response OmpR family regulator